MTYKSQLKKRIEETIKKNNIFLPKPPYENRIEGWWFNEDDISKANNKGKMLTLDLDIGKACDLHCSFCFANTHSKDSADYVKRTTNRIKNLLTEASKLGIKSIKIVGAGEPLLFPGIIDILRHCKRLKIKPLIFTGGHVFGDDRRTKNIFKKEGIKSGLELAKKLKELDCSFIVKFMTFKPSLHNKIVGVKFNYVKLRDNGLLSLIKIGLNSYKPTRLGVDCLLLKENYKESVDLFGFFNKYNIYCVLNTSMDCGKTEFRLANPQVISKDKALHEAIRLYSYCIKHKIPFDKRISSYFCSPVCSQLNHGLFIGDNDEVRACPGGPTIAKYQKGNLKEIWKNNPFRKKFNQVIGHKCISRIGRTYHEDFEERVIKKLNIA